MALSKDYTLTIVRGIILLWQKEINISELDPDLVNDFINLGILDVFTGLQDVLYKDYGRTTVLSEAGAAFIAAGIVASAGFTDATKNMEDTAHGLTSADVGKRVMFMDIVDGTGVAAHLTITNIVAKIDDDNFTVLHSPGVNLPIGGPSSKCVYVVLPSHSSDVLDLSALRINRVRKLIDSITGEVVEVKDARDFENLSKFPQKQSKIYWYQNGEQIFLFKGSSVSAYGTLTLHYYGKPIAVAADGDFLDIKDEYVPLAIQKTQEYIIYHLKELSKQLPADQKANLTRNVKTSEDQKETIRR